MAEGRAETEAEGVGTRTFCFHSGHLDPKLGGDKLSNLLSYRSTHLYSYTELYIYIYIHTHLETFRGKDLK